SLMERVTLLHPGEEVAAATLAPLCLPGTVPEPSAAAQAPAPVPQSAPPAEAEQIRQALTQTGGNVVQAARLLGVSRETLRYRMQRYGIQRSRPAAVPPVVAEPAPAPLGAPPQADILPSDPPRPAVEPTPARSAPEPSAGAHTLAREGRLPASDV